MALDPIITRAIAQVDQCHAGGIAAPHVQGFFDPASFTISYVVHDPASRRAAIIDSVRDFDQASGRTGHVSADRLIDYVRQHDLTVDWVLETHAHADHLSAAPYVQRQLGGQTGIGRAITTVQSTFAELFNEGADVARDGSQFDRLLDDGDRLMIGDIPLIALAVPGHTPADMAYLIGDALFVGDTMFMPDYGSARCDFPGGDAGQLFRSVRRMMGLPDATRMFLCHDYKAPGRDDYAWESSIGAQRTGNIHLNQQVAEADFIAMRAARDATLTMPRLILPALQVNIRAGHAPDPESNGVRYLKLPLDRL